MQNKNDTKKSSIQESGTRAQSSSENKASKKSGDSGAKERNQSSTDRNETGNKKK